MNDISEMYHLPSACVKHEQDFFSDPFLTCFIAWHCITWGWRYRLLCSSSCRSCFFFFAIIGIWFCFIFKLYKIVLVLPNIKMNPPQVYMCSPSWTLHPPPSPYHPSGSSKCTSPKHPVSCIEPGLVNQEAVVLD